MNRNAIMVVIVTVLAVCCALFIGVYVAEGSYEKLGLMAGSAFVICICLTLYKRIWMLIPLCGSFSGSIGMLPGNIKVSEIAIIIAFGLTFVLSALKVIPRMARWNLYDKLLLINLAYLATVYARNPAGVLLFQTDIIGGRPYFEIFLAFLAYLTLQHVTLTYKQTALIPILICVGAVASSFLSAITAFLPNVAEKILPIYTGVTMPEQLDSVDVAYDVDARKGYLAGFGNSVGPTIVAFYDPSRILLFLNPAISFAYLLAIAAILLSGFRSVLVSLIVMTAFSVYFRGGIGAVARLSVVFIVAIGLLLVVQSAGFQLPLPAQRALSFLPGSWDPQAASDARGSSEWRFEMWRQALTTDRYIHNKLLGDGFGFRIQDIQGFESLGGMASAGHDQIQEYFLMIGSYHSGPVSAIRFVGAIGLLLLTVYMFACAMYAWRLILKSNTTPFFPMALFFGCPSIFMPVSYWLIFGTADSAYVGLLLNLGFLNMLDRSLNEYSRRQSL